MNDQLMGSSELLIEKLKDLANHDEFTHKNNHSERSITALSNHARTRPITCKNGVHNPNAAHPESKCWALHPDQRPVRRINNRHANNSSGASSNLTTQISDPSSEYDKPAFANYIIAQSFSTQVTHLKPVIDTGSSHHMFNDEKFFLNSSPCHIPISTGHGSDGLVAEQMGMAAIIQDLGKVFLLEGALYVPDLTRNLISLGKLIRNSVLIEKVGGSHVVNIDDGIRFTCSMINGVLDVHSHIGPISASYAAISLATHSAPTTPFWTWHSRLGHAIIHGDIVGPITPSTNSGKRYFLTLVDQHTGYISVTLLKQKSEAMDAFLAFKIFFEKQTGHFIKKLITDGGGEFVNKNLNNALESFRIQHNISPPYTPQHNGVAERANKTIINMARCMLSQSNLAKEWWGEAVRTAMAVTNCLPSVRRGKVSPIQLMFVIGYSNDYSSYKVIRLPNKSIIETKHAYFDESVFPTLGALKPSVDHFPHSGLPDFESAALFSFQEEDNLNTFQDEGCVPDEQEEERMVLDYDEVHEQEQPLEDQAKDLVSSREDSSPAPPPRRLIIHGPRHPTLINSSVDSGNILCYPRCPAVAFSTHTVEPRNHLQAMNSNNKDEWVKAEQREIDNMLAHNVWNEVPARPDIVTIPSTWVYKKKLGSNNEVVEFKAHICAQGFRQTHGLNFDLKYAPTGKPSSLRLLLSFAASSQLLIHQLDVKSAFLTCDLDEKVYLTPPAGYRTGANVFLALNKAIYGLKQASLAWYNRLRNFLVKIGFSVSIADPCVFWRSSDLTWIFAHVDNLIIVSKQPKTFVKQMSAKFQIKYMGAASFLLGMKLERASNGLILHQDQYIKHKLSEFNFTEFPPSTCPIDPKSHLQKATLDELAQFAALGVNCRALVGSLKYLAILTRPDIAYSVSKLSQFLEQPGISHFRAAVQVFRYLHHTKSLGLLFGMGGSEPPIISVNADWGNCPDTRRSHTGYLATLNHHIISWKSCKQSTISLSSTKAEYKALSDAGKEASWLINLCQEIFEDSPVKTAIIEVDNRGAINLARSQVSQNGFRTKHMDLWLHHIRDLICAKTISLKYVALASNSSDFLTKPVGRSKITRSLQSHTATALNIGASHPTVPSMGACLLLPA
ncbi:hypothetical protein PCANC_15858 [Puccinia coronata f. sp. avenae]|uniref:Integrase catalytic domain-containing protein n=1 Tax=Puccinia coronata f. sp. avenae TaxID=200324 RepID=A0A2N5UPL6_9BASI|nr:hypothetical protein PCANC_15858 [Puccinia coronata f. sp. avenae]